jgi:NitT/TauT family transport system ATP-binding protein
MHGADTLQVAIRAKAFGARAVLRDIDFSSAPGEVIALLAPSGSGKTTALRIVMGLDDRFTGKVRRPPGRLGAVFQEPRLLPWMDVLGNLRLVAPRLASGEAEQLLGKVGLPGVAQLYPGQLSLGMARRVAVARALATRPSLLVMDEPFASLDPQLAATLSRETAAFARALGSTALIATHDLEQALAVADRILVLGEQTLAADLPAASTNAAAMRERFPFLIG